METKEALRIISLLADGHHPITGKKFPEDSPYQQADVVRALYTAAHVMSEYTKKEKRGIILPRSGLPWSKSEDEQLCDEFNTKSIDEMATIHNRTKGAIQSRLMKLGKISYVNDIVSV